MQAFLEGDIMADGFKLALAGLVYLIFILQLSLWRRTADKLAEAPYLFAFIFGLGGLLIPSFFLIVEPFVLVISFGIPFFMASFLLARR